MTHESAQPLRLFEVNGIYFANKKEAKASRDAINKNFQEDVKIHLGPDHRLYGVKGHPTTHHNRMMKGKKK